MGAPSTRDLTSALLGVGAGALLALWWSRRARERSLWSLALKLGKGEQIVEGSTAALARAVSAGADVRISSRFRHNEHINPSSSNSEMVEEASMFPISMALYGSAAAYDRAEPSYSAFLMTARQPVNPDDPSGQGGFNGRPAIAIFLYNQNGQQARAAVQLDGEALGVGEALDGRADAKLATTEGAKYPQVMLDGRMVVQSEYDAKSNAPCKNFIYSFDAYYFFAAERWELALHTGPDGSVRGGSFCALEEATRNGSRVKLGIRNFCADLAKKGTHCCEHETFVEVGWCFYYPESKKMCAATQLVVRVAPEGASGPVLYRSGNWDVGWLYAESSGHCAYRQLDPYTLAWEVREMRHELRWFIQK